MGKIITHTFEDVVKAIGTKPGDNEYMVIFKQHAAFYKIDKARLPEIEILKESREKGNRVTIKIEARTLEILDVSFPEAE